MSKVLYEGNVGNYSFVMSEYDTIEVWSSLDLEEPDSYIFVKEGSIKTEKQFHQEISYWFMNNVG
jgi:hypothetical protein